MMFDETLSLPFYIFYDGTSISTTHINMIYNRGPFIDDKIYRGQFIDYEIYRGQFIDYKI